MGASPTQHKALERFSFAQGNQQQCIKKVTSVLKGFCPAVNSRENIVSKVCFLYINLGFHGAIGTCIRNTLCLNAFPLYVNLNAPIALMVQ